nr:MAG TPA: hypothetical protein [Caudoviricetes sp.]
MKLGDEAVSALYIYLNKNIKAIGIKEGRIFKYEIPDDLPTGDYIAINHLPFVNSEVINEGVVNMNIHCPKTSKNLPDTKRLVDIEKKVLALVMDGIYLDGCYFALFSDSRPTRDNDDTYYINLKFTVTYNNLKD